MSTMLIATDYSRPIQPLFEQAVQVGSVHSVFPRAMNVAFGDTLLSVLSDELPRMPNSVRLPAAVAERLLQEARPGMVAFVGDMPVSVGAGEEVLGRVDPCGRPWGGENVPNGFGSPGKGDRKGQGSRHPASSATPAPKEKPIGHPQGDAPTRTRRGCLAIPEIGHPQGDAPTRTRAHGCFIALPSVAAWEPCPQLALLQWNRDVVARHMHMLAYYLAEVAHEEGMVSLVGPLLLGRSTQMSVLAQKALPMVRLLMQAGWGRNYGDVERAACGLLGLGPGLTPSGDDVLAGFAAVMTLLSMPLSVDGLSREDIALRIAAAAPSRTTRLSATLLRYAARGEVAEQLGNVLMALAGPIEASEAVMHAARDLLRFGATSGGDTLLGVLLGLRTLAGSGW